MLELHDEYPAPECPDQSPVSTGRIMANNSTVMDMAYFKRFAGGIRSNLM
jgi:hypothetical protein